MLTDAQRHDLYLAALNSWGQGPADALMSLIPPGGWEDVARRGDVADLRGEFVGLRGEFAELRGEFAELRGEFAEFRAHMDAQYTKFVALNISVNIGAMIGVAGLVLAAAKLS